MKTINNFIKIIIFLVVLNGGILLITYVLTPKIPSFYWEKHYDAVFFGTSQSYCSFDPLIFDEYDFNKIINSFHFSSSRRFVPSNTTTALKLKINKISRRISTSPDSKH